MKQFFICFLIVCFNLPSVAFAQTISSQETGALDTFRLMEEKTREIQEKIKNLERLQEQHEEERRKFYATYNIENDIEPKEAVAEAINPIETTTQIIQVKKPVEIAQPPKQVPLPKAVAPAVSETTDKKIFVKMITVEGVTALPKELITSIVEPYQNKELSVSEIQKLKDSLTDAYRKNGFVTSRAYIPPQEMVNNILIIKIIEGKIGQVKIEGNRHSSSKLLRKYVNIKEGSVFDYEALRKDMDLINQRPDRQVSGVLTPGQESGTSDVILKVNERLPIHLNLTFDNFGSKYTNDYRYQAVLTHNNFLGFDDTLAIQYQLSPNEAYKLGGVKYNFPLFDKTQLGLYASRSYSELDDVLRNSGTRGKSTVYAMNLTQQLYQEGDLNVSANVGFTYKDVYNFNQGPQLNEDRLRIAQGGMTADIADSLGRTIISNGVDVGIPGILDGTKKHPATLINGGFASRDGGGGQFVKDTTDLIRVQNLPIESKLLIKSQYQLSSRILNATEQYQIGGISNNRGYPNGEAVGDSGGYVSSELSFPFYMIPKEFKMPFSTDRIYDALRMEGFFDYGRVSLRRPSANEAQNKTLRSVGTGLRLNMSDSSYARVDYAWPMGVTPSDGDKNGRLWFQISKDF